MSDVATKNNERPKQPILKRWYVWAIAFLLLGIITICMNSKNNGNNTVSSEIILEYPEGPMQEIESIVRNRVANEYEASEITTLNILDETDNGKDDYTVMVYLNFNRQNKSKTTKEMLETYSSDLAATLANERTDVGDVNVYWTIPYLKEKGKKIGNGENYWIYTRKGGGMAVKDENWIYE